MYAEERQQAIADLVAQRGRLSVNELAAEYDVTTETVRRDLSALERAGLRPPGARRRRPGRRAHRCWRPGSATATSANTDEKDRIARGRARPAARDRRQRAAGRRHHHRPAGRCCSPATCELTVSPTPCRSPPGWPASPTSTCTCCPAGSAPPPRRPSATRPSGALASSAPTSPSSAPTGSPRPRPHHPRPRRGRRQARHRRRRPPGRGARGLVQDRPRSTWSGSPGSSDIDVRRHRRGHRRRRPRGPRASDVEAVRRMVARSHDRHADPQPQHRPHRRPGRRRSVRGAVLRAESVDLAGRRQGRQHLPRRGRRQRADDRRAARPHKDDPFVVELLRDGIDCRPEPPAGDRPRQPHPHRARRHHHQGQQPRRRGHPDDLDRAGGRRAPARAAGAAWVVLAGSLPPGRPRRLVRRPGRAPCAAPAPASRSTPRARRCVALAAALEQQAPAPDEAQRRGARLAHRRRRRR